jgi:hypothetical protein
MADEGSSRAELIEASPAPALDLPSPPRKPRGRPLGSKNKPKPPVVVTRESKAAMSPAVLELAGYKVAAFVRYRRVGVSLALCYEAAALSLPPRSGSRPRWRPR